MSEPPIPSPATALLRRVRSELGTAWSDDDLDTPPPHPVPLPSRVSTAGLAWASVRAASLAGDIVGLPDPERIAVSFRSDRVLTIDGSAPDVWSAYSGFWRSADGWIRTHANYAHHATRLLAALGLSPGSAGEAVATALERLPAEEAVHLITVNGGLAVPVAREDRRADAELRATPLLDAERVDSPSVARSRAARPHADSPLSGIRVLDLTRVIAGPVCTRTLALLGADVLRIDPLHLAEPEWQHLDTGHGKRSSLLDAHTDRLRELLDAADVVVLGYRPASLERLGLSPRALARQHPGAVIAQLSAWGIDHPHRAGFDSLVQAASGIAMIESPDGRQPGVLPAQALDHSAGYLLAAAVTALVRRQRREGGTWIVRTSLRRIAAELLGMPRRIDPEKAREFDAGAHTSSFLVDGSTVITASAALPGLEFAAPRRWGADQARW